MIILKGKTLPNFQWWFTNLNRFVYYSGTNEINIGTHSHSESGTSNIDGNFELELYPAEYQIHLGSKNLTTVYFKNLKSGSDFQTLDFGNKHTYLNKDVWEK